MYTFSGDKDVFRPWQAVHQCPKRFLNEHGGHAAYSKFHKKQFFSAVGEKTTYLMGDTIWTARVTKTLHSYQPDIMIMNTGYAKALGFNEGIIMGTADVAKAAEFMPNSKLVAVHMDAINHCTVSRKNMRDFIHMMNLEKQVYVPNDGETVNFDK